MTFLERQTRFPDRSGRPDSGYRGRAMEPRESSAGLAQGREYGVTASVRNLWERWKQVARKIGDFQARALMTLFYFVILGPVAMALRWRSDPLALKATTPRGWSVRETRAGAPMEHARRQF
jgi:hypothetical protein